MVSKMTPGDYNQAKRYISTQCNNIKYPPVIPYKIVTPKPCLEKTSSDPAPDPTAQCRLGKLAPPFLL